MGQVEAALKAMPVVVLTGARQTGKTTLTSLLAGQRRYYTLDDYEILDQAARAPDALLAELPVTLDEVQRAPGILLAVKRVVDTRRVVGSVLLTGSANLLLSHKISESLAGRAVYIELQPCCPCEWLGRIAQLDRLTDLFRNDLRASDWPEESGEWREWLLSGGYPPVLSMEPDSGRDFWFRGYVQTFVERDLRALSEISNLADFQKLMKLVANQAGRLINQANLARDSALSHATAHRYLNLLETACLLVRLPAFTTGITGQVVKSPRWFWTDCGLAAYLAGIRDPSTLAARPDSGAWLEQTLFQTFQLWRALDPVRRKLYYWRDPSGREVDLILEQDEALVAIEIKQSNHVGVDDARGIQAFKQMLGRRRDHLIRGVVLHAGQPRQLDSDILALPFGWMTPATGSKIDHG